MVCYHRNLVGKLKIVARIVNTGQLLFDKLSKITEKKVFDPKQLERFSVNLELRFYENCVGLK